MKASMDIENNENYNENLISITEPTEFNKTIGSNKVRNISPDQIQKIKEIQKPLTAGEGQKRQPWSNLYARNMVLNG